MVELSHLGHSNSLIKPTGIGNQVKVEFILFECFYNTFYNNLTVKLVFFKRFHTNKNKITN